MTIFKACSVASTVYLRALIEQGEEVNQWDEAYGETPLHLASRLRKPGAARLLLDAGADVNGLNKDEETPLHVACTRGYTVIVHILLSHGADVNIRDAREETALDKILRWPAGQSSRGSSREEIMDLFRQYAPEQVMEAYWQANEALLRACEFGDIETVRSLLEKGAGLDTKDKWKYTPLHAACVHGYPDIARLLLKKGADATVTDWGDTTPLDYAMKIPLTNPFREVFLNLFRDHAPEATLEGVLKLPPDDPLRERALDWYREHHPDLVMEAWCTSELRMG